MKKILQLIFLISMLFSFAQVVVKQEKFPTENQKKLIDEFIEVSNYRQAILNVANTRIFIKSMKHNNDKTMFILNDEDRSRVLNEISKRYLRKDKLYFDFMNLTENNLSSLIEFYTENKNLTLKNDYIFASGVIFHNLDNEIDTIIRGILNEKK